MRENRSGGSAPTVLRMVLGKRLRHLREQAGVSFEDAARRTAQIAHDLGLPLVPMLYSWPSEGAVLRYGTDAANVEWTIPHFTEFLSM